MSRHYSRYYGPVPPPGWDGYGDRSRRYDDRDRDRSRIRDRDRDRRDRRPRSRSPYRPRGRSPYRRSPYRSPVDRRRRPRSRSRSPRRRDEARSRSPARDSRSHDRWRSRSPDELPKSPVPSSESEDNSDSDSSVHESDVEWVEPEEVDNDDNEELTSAKKNKILSEAVICLTQGKPLSAKVSKALESNMQEKGYVDRAKAVIERSGIELPDQELSLPEPALSNPKGKRKSDICFFPVSPLVSSRLSQTWKSMCGLKQGIRWDPESFTLPPNPPESLPKLKLNHKYYKTKCQTLPEKGYQNEAAISGSSKGNASVSVSKLNQWEQNTALGLRILNTVDFFTSDIVNTVMPLAEKYLPKEEFVQLKANVVTRGRAFQDLASTLAWQTGELVSTHRATVLQDSSLNVSDKARKILKLQKLEGPLLFNGKAQKIVAKDSKDATGKVCRAASKNLMNRGEADKRKQEVKRVPSGNSFRGFGKPVSDFKFDRARNKNRSRQPQWRRPNNKSKGAKSTNPKSN